MEENTEIQENIEMEKIKNKEENGDVSSSSSSNESDHGQEQEEKHENTNNNNNNNDNSLLNEDGSELNKRKKGRNKRINQEEDSESFMNVDELPSLTIVRQNNRRGENESTLRRLPTRGAIFTKTRVVLHGFISILDSVIGFFLTPILTLLIETPFKALSSVRWMRDQLFSAINEAKDARFELKTSAPESAPEAVATKKSIYRGKVTRAVILWTFGLVALPIFAFGHFLIKMATSLFDSMRVGIYHGFSGGMQRTETFKNLGIVFSFEEEKAKVDKEIDEGRSEVIAGEEETEEESEEETKKDDKPLLKSRPESNLNSEVSPLIKFTSTPRKKGWSPLKIKGLKRKIEADEERGLNFEIAKEADGADAHSIFSALLYEMYLYAHRNSLQQDSSEEMAAQELVDQIGAPQTEFRAWDILILLAFIAVITFVVVGALILLVGFNPVALLLGLSFIAPLAAHVGLLTGIAALTGVASAMAYAGVATVIVTTAAVAYLTIATVASKVFNQMGRFLMKLRWLIDPENPQGYVWAGARRELKDFFLKHNPLVKTLKVLWKGTKAAKNYRSCYSDAQPAELHWHGFKNVKHWPSSLRALALALAPEFVVKKVRGLNSRAVADSSGDLDGNAYMPVENSKRGDAAEEEVISPELAVYNDAVLNAKIDDFKFNILEDGKGYFVLDFNKDDSSYQFMIMCKAPHTVAVSTEDYDFEELKVTDYPEALIATEEKQKHGFEVVRAPVDDGADENESNDDEADKKTKQIKLISQAFIDSLNKKPELEQGASKKPNESSTSMFLGSMASRAEGVKNTAKRALGGVVDVAMVGYNSIYGNSQKEIRVTHNGTVSDRSLDINNNG